MTKEKTQKALKLEERIAHLEKNLDRTKRATKVHELDVVIPSEDYNRNYDYVRIDPSFIQWDVVKVLAINAIQTELDAKKAEYDAL